MAINDFNDLDKFSEACDPQDAKEPTEPADDRHRLQRLKRSAILQMKLSGVGSPEVKGAECIDEYKQAFKLAHDEYVSCGYIQENPEHPYYYSTFSFLPKTCIFVFKSFHNVIATLTQIFDNNNLGLPMDSLYKKELDVLRNQDREVVELSAFVTSRQFRMQNIIMYLCKAMFMHSNFHKVDDICVMVNPKHVSFYTKMFLFEPFGPELFYEKVQAPAVPLRLDMRYIHERLRDKYGTFDKCNDLHAFFCGRSHPSDRAVSFDLPFKGQETSQEIMQFFRFPQIQALAA